MSRFVGGGASLIVQTAEWFREQQGNAVVTPKLGGSIESTKINARF